MPDTEKLEKSLHLLADRNYRRTGGLLVFSAFVCLLNGLVLLYNATVIGPWLESSRVTALKHQQELQENRRLVEGINEFLQEVKARIQRAEQERMTREKKAKEAKAREP